MKELDKCVEECKEAASKFAATSINHKFRIEKAFASDALNAKKVEKVREVLNRELPIRLPGVTADLSDLRLGNEYDICWHVALAW